MSATIPFLKPSVVPRQAYQSYLDEIDQARWYSNYGPLNTRFEQQVVAEYFAAQGAVITVCNATMGLMLSIASVRRPGGRYAIMPSFTFAATALAARWCGLEPYFVDVRESDWCMDEGLARTALDALGEQVAVVVPYPTLGTWVDLSFYELLLAQGIPVVVDAAPCFGTTLDGKQLGAGFPGPIVFSFHATKAFGIGEGGMVYSADPDQVRQIRQASNFGFSASRETTLLGLNAKMSEFSAARALATLDTFAERLANRRRLIAMYRGHFRDRGLFDRGWLLQPTRGMIAHQFMSVCCPIGLKNDDVIRYLDGHDIESRKYFSPACHQQQFFAQCSTSGLPVTEQLAARCISLPFYDDMESAEIQRVVAVLAHAN